MARKCTFIFLACVYTAIFLASSCLSYSGSDGGDYDNNGKGDDVEDGDECTVLMCDAVCIPVVTFEFVIVDTGEHYCGPADISYRGEYKNEAYGPYRTSCICDDGEMKIQPGDYYNCHVDPYGHALITVEVEGYERFTAEVDIPSCECHPQIPVRVELVSL